MEDFTYQLIVQHEGWRTKVYKDTLGNPTIGVGLNLNASAARGLLAAVGANYDAVRAGVESLTDAQVAILYNRQLITASSQAYLAVPGLGKLPLKVQAVCTDMCFNLGMEGFLKFKHFIAALSQQDFTTAAAALKDSVWFTQVPARALTDYNLVLGCAAPATATPLQGA